MIPESGSVYVIWTHAKDDGFLAFLGEELGEPIVLDDPDDLDELDLSRDILYTVRRDDDGTFSAYRVPIPSPVCGDLPVPLSKAYRAGYIGGF